MTLPTRNSIEISYERKDAGLRIFFVYVLGKRPISLWGIRNDYELTGVREADIICLSLSGCRKGTKKSEYRR